MCVAVARLPDMNRMSDVKAYTRQMAPKEIYDQIEECGDAGWMLQQGRLLEVVQKEKEREKKEKACAACGKDDPVSRCSLCKHTRYCSVDCQRAHWKVHKQDCVTI